MLLERKYVCVKDWQKRKNKEREKSVHKFIFISIVFDLSNCQYPSNRSYDLRWHVKIVVE